MFLGVLIGIRMDSSGIRRDSVRDSSGLHVLLREHFQGSFWGSLGFFGGFLGIV